MVSQPFFGVFVALFGATDLNLTLNLRGALVFIKSRIGPQAFKPCLAGRIRQRATARAHGNGKKQYRKTHLPYPF